MPRFVDRTGKRYGRLTVRKKHGHNHLKKVMWLCDCDCGGETLVPSGSLSSGNTRSCGCLLRDTITKHGGFGKRSYNTWRAVVRRCNNPEDKDYPRYGGKGITVCDRWLDYTAFAADMGEPPEGHTLDRIDNSGGYNPENCRWATFAQQIRNSRHHANKGVMKYCTGSGYRWYAHITVGGTRHYSKVVDSVEEARILRKEMEDKFWGANR